MYNRGVKLELKIPNRLGKMSEKLRVGDFLDSHCTIFKYCSVALIKLTATSYENQTFAPTNRISYIWRVLSF